MLAMSGAPAAQADVFKEKIEPFAKKYCHTCHNKKQAKGELDLTRYARDGDVTSDFRRWNSVIEFVRKGVMPPSDHKNQPTLEERGAVVGAIEAILLVEAKKHAGDPGVVLPRRLSNTEYDLSIRDLTGVTIQATKEFPVDPAGGEGFNNTGEALAMTPSLLNKYLGAAQLVSDHLVLKPSGITFAPFLTTAVWNVAGPYSTVRWGNLGPIPYVFSFFAATGAAIPAIIAAELAAYTARRRHQSP
jgi:hypothetical protein